MAVIAAERGTTVRNLVADLAQATPTREELDARTAAASALIRAHLVPDFDADDEAAGERMWRDLAAGRLTEIG